MRDFLQLSRIISGTRWVTVEVYSFGGIVGSRISYPGGKIMEMGEWREGVWRWNVTWRRELFQYESAMLASLL